MRNDDNRSWVIALVPDRVLGAPSETDAASVYDCLEDLGFGVIQLPPGGIGADAVARAVGFALDQVEDYADAG